MTVTILQGDVRDRLRSMADESVHCVVTSPPYWGLRDYGADGQIGLEATLPEHIALMVDVFSEVRRVLRKDGTCWLNYGDAYAGSWGAQSRLPEEAGKDTYNPSKVSANQIRAAQQRTGTGSTARTPGLKPKDRMLLPARLAIALCDDGWWVRDEIVWHKPNPMPSSVTDRTTPAHEMLYLLTRSARYTYDKDAIREPAVTANWNDGSRVYGGANKHGANEKHGDRTTGRRTGPNSGINVDRVPVSRKVKVPGGWDKGEGAHGTIHRDGRTAAEYVEQEVSPWRNKRSVWTVAPSPFPEAHFATFPPALIEPCILAGCPAGGTVLDPFFGSGTTGLVAQQHGRNCIGIELNPDYVAIAQRRLGLPYSAGVFA